MIWFIFASFYKFLVTGLIGFFSISPVTVLPFGVDELFVAGFGTVRFISAFFPPLGIVMSGFLFMMVFYILMFTLKQVRLIK